MPTEGMRRPGRSSWGVNAKVQAAGAAGAATTVLVWAASLAGVDVPPEVAAAITALISVGAGWLKPETSPPKETP